MNRFGQFNIKVAPKGFEGEKIKMSKILNREITVIDFKIEESKVKAFKENGSGKCLHLQISFNDELHIVFTSSSGLIDAISQIPKEGGFPFTTTIIQDGERFMFT
jgi:hypothetical protein